LASLGTTEHRSQSCLHVLHKLILLDHAYLILMHECINVGAFFNESGTEVGTLLRLYFAHDVEEHIEENIGIGDLTCFAHQAHNLIHTPGKGNHLEDRRTNVPDLLNLFDSLLESISCLLIPYRRL
jgi:hypothetical protein